MGAAVSTAGAPRRPRRQGPESAMRALTGDVLGARGTQSRTPASPLTPRGVRASTLSPTAGILSREAVRDLGGAAGTPPPTELFHSSLRFVLSP